MGALLSEPVTALAVERASGRSWAASAVSMQGWRKSHEDAHILQCSAGGAESSAVFAVLDGHGGCTAARTGARLLEERLTQLARRGTPVDEAAAAKELHAAFIETDAALRRSMGDEDRSGSTAVAALVSEPAPEEYCIQLANCGDSRAVLFTGGRLIATEDHKPDRPDETARIKAAGGSVEHGPLGGGPLRVDGSLAVSRALGDFHFKPPGARPEACKVTSMPECFNARCGPGDWLCLCCDGVFDVMSNEELRDFLQLRLCVPDTFDAGPVLCELLQLCLDKGSKDNCTAVLVQFGPPPVGVEGLPARQLIPRDARTCGDAQVRTKYLEFFEAEGFPAEAAEYRDFIASAPLPAKSGRGSEASRLSNSSTGQASSGRSSSGGQLAAFAKALQAVRSTRAIQTAWRNSRKDSGQGGSGADD